MTNIDLSNDDWLAIEREYCARSLANFVKRAWHVVEPGTDLKWGWAVDAICQHLEAVTSGDVRRLLINCPPGLMKSLLVGVFWPAWEWGPKGKPGLKYVSTSYQQDLAIRDARKMRLIIESEWYQNLWPMELAHDANAKTYFENTARGFRSSTAFTGMTGKRGDRVILDDPHSVKGGESEAMREETITTFREALPSRVNSKDSAIVIIMQRIHENDVSGNILSRIEDTDYVHLMLPMRFEPERACATRIGFTDPRQEDGELLFPEFYDEERTQELEGELGDYATAGQLQQRPVPREGGSFKRTWFEVVPAAPADTFWVRGWDLAATKSKNNRASKGPAYTAGVKCGYSRSAKCFYISNSTRDRLESAGVEQLIKNTASQDGKFTIVDIPQDPGQAGKSQIRYLVAALAGYDVHFSPESGDKEVRADPVASQAKAGNVKIIEGKWNEAYLDEIELFPNGTYKDQVDATSRAFARLFQMIQNEPTGDFAAPIILSAGG